MMPRKKRDGGEAGSYRRPCFVRESVHFSDTAYPLCPRCRRPMEREYQQYCDRCGQALNWDLFQDTAV